MEASSATSVKQLISIISDKGKISVSVLEGSVISGSPLKITLTNDTKMVLTSVDLIVPEHLRAYAPVVKIAGNNYTIPVRDGLAAGDKVYLLVFNNGKKFYVLDRV